MTRAPILVVSCGLAFAGCDHCTELASSATRRPASSVVGAGDQVIVAWAELAAASAQDHVSAFDSAGHALGSAAVPDDHLGDLVAVGGQTSVLLKPFGFGAPPFAVDLAPLDDLASATSITVSADLVGAHNGNQISAAVYDGHAYQLFWATSTQELQQRSLAEDGTLGAVHTIASGIMAPYLIEASSDGAGTVFLDGVWTTMQTTGLVEAFQGILIDTATGTADPLWQAASTFGSCGHAGIGGTAVWGGDAFELLGCTYSPDGVGAIAPQVVAIHPGDRSITTTDLDAALVTTRIFRASGPRRLAVTDTELVELDPTFAIVARTASPLGADDVAFGALANLAAFDGDWVYVDEIERDGDRPAHADVIRLAAASPDSAAPIWQTHVVEDSPVIHAEECHPEH